MLFFGFPFHHFLLSASSAIYPDEDGESFANSEKKLKKQ